MSKAYKCDRCGGFYDTGERATIMGNPIDIIKIYSHYETVQPIKTYDLCPKCANEFVNWLNNEDKIVTDLIDDSRR